MSTYWGKFRCNNQDEIQVTFTTASGSNNTEFKLAGENPVVINQSSSDGIFSPIKSRSCTVKMLTDTLYTDLYSGEAKGVSCTVQNITTNQTLFFGYVTPCNYNQPYVNIDELEIECVDAISALEDIKYTYHSGTSGSLVTIFDILDRLLHTIAGYTGTIYTPETTPRYFGYVSPFKDIYIDDSNFFDDDEEKTPSTCYEVLEEIAKFYGLSICPMGQDVWIVDNKATVRYGIQYPSYPQRTDGTLSYVNLTTEYTHHPNVKKEIKKEDYFGDNQNISLEPIYNKIQLTDNVYDVEVDTGDILSDDADMNYYTYEKEIIPRDAGEKWVTYDKYFNLGTGKWKQYFWKMTNNTPSARGVYDVTADTVPTSSEGWTNYYNNTILNECCMPMLVCNINENEAVPEKHDWKKYLCFFTQAHHFGKVHGYINDNNFPGYVPGSFGNRRDLLWNNYFRYNFSHKVLEYTSDDVLDYSPKTSDTTNYFVWQGDLEYDLINTWRFVGSSISYPRSVGFSTTPWSEFGYNDDIDQFLEHERSSGDTGYNTGWPVLKAELKIGNKYWNGSAWTTTSSSFFINYHQVHQNNNLEKLLFNSWNTPVVNRDFTYNIPIEGWSIPITQADKLCGKMYFALYTPVIPWNEQLGENVSGNGYPYREDKIPPVIWLKEPKLTFTTCDNREWWKGDTWSDTKNDDDIVYSTDIAGNNVDTFDSLELKINTLNTDYYMDKPMARSYIVSPDWVGGFDPHPIENTYKKICDECFQDYYAGTTKIPEKMVLERYYDHYSSPKIVYECEVRNYYPPYMCCEPDIFPNKRFIVDEQEYDLKTNKNSLKIIEY